jgi:beta-carotene hydroxylase
VSREFSASEFALLEPEDSFDHPGWPPISDDLNRVRLRQLRKQEIAVARRFHGGARWPYAAISVACFLVWLSFFPLAIMGELNLPLAFVLSCIFVSGGYITAHEAMHSNIARKGEKLRWLNELTGHISTIPLIVPYSMVKTIHLRHHQHTNDPDKDPDFIHGAASFAGALLSSWRIRQPGGSNTAMHWRRHVAEIGTPEAKSALVQTMAMQLVAMALFFAMAWSGYAIELVAIWWLPRHVGLTYMHTVLSWATHHPHGRRGRYANTKVIRHPLGYIGTMGIEYHIVHHLYPNIPLHATRAAYYEMKPLLEARGVDCSAK